MVLERVLLYLCENKNRNPLEPTKPYRADLTNQPIQIDRRKKTDTDRQTDRQTHKD